MASVIFEERVEIPLGIESLAEFRRWALSDEFPETGRIDFVAGRIEVEVTPGDLFGHGMLKTELNYGLGSIIKQFDHGDLFASRSRVSMPAVGLSVQPDLIFVEHAAILEGRVQLVPDPSGKPDRYVELEGAPDLVVEIVSDSSVRKDTERLPPAYFAAGVREFWLADARGEALLFQIHRRGPAGYEPAARDADGFQPSEVFGGSFRLDRCRDALGHWAFDLKRKAE